MAKPLFVLVFALIVACGAPAPAATIATAAPATPEPTAATPPAEGTPFRLITPGLGDLCANVKNVARIEFTCGPGKDTRPSVPKQH